MTLAELREIFESVRRIPCGHGGAVPAEVHAFNASVGRFHEQVVRVRNRLVLAGCRLEPASADLLRRQAAALSASRPELGA